MAQTVSPQCSPLDQGASLRYDYSKQLITLTNERLNNLLSLYLVYFFPKSMEYFKNLTASGSSFYCAIKFTWQNFQTVSEQRQFIDNVQKL